MTVFADTGEANELSESTLDSAVKARIPGTKLVPLRELSTFSCDVHDRLKVGRWKIGHYQATWTEDVASSSRRCSYAVSSLLFNLVWRPVEDHCTWIKIAGKARPAANLALRLCKVDGLVDLNIVSSSLDHAIPD